MSIGVVSYLAAFVACLVMTLLLATTWRGRLSGFLMVSAMGASTLWAGASAAILWFDYPQQPFFFLAELLRDGGWLLFLARILGPSERRDESARRTVNWMWVVSAALGAAAALILLLPAVASRVGFFGGLDVNVVFSLWLLLSLLGLFLVEQVYRNRPPEQRWGIKHLCLAIGGFFAYDFYMYSDALLFQRLDLGLWEARGLVNMLVVPLIAVSAARNPDWTLDVHVSRPAVVHSVTLLGAGVYLMLMALAGYYVRFVGGAWGMVLQIAFLFGAGVFLLLLLFSGQLRSYLRVMLSKHFFTLKYDYREEWLRFTNALAHGERDVPETVLKALLAIIGSSGGGIWIKRKGAVFELAARVHLPEAPQQAVPADHPLAEFLEASGWVVDLAEYKREPEFYEGLNLSEGDLRLPAASLIVPLFFGDELLGFVILVRPGGMARMNWEDRDLLKTAGRQAASYIAQHQADQALLQARQFEAFNQLSAYVVHDLKNILAQQALIVVNAEKHKHKPEFIEDVVLTVRSSVDRMKRLMEQLREGIRGEQREPVLLDALLGEVIGAHGKRKPVPAAEDLEPRLVVEADRERLATVFGHIIQNAQEATPEGGAVRVRLRREGAQAVVEVQDSGKGMTPEFVRERLFRPFDSTKGLTGMGIGAFESREMIRSLGGDILVQSTPGTGSLFRISLPCRTWAGVLEADTQTAGATSR